MITFTSVLVSAAILQVTLSQKVVPTECRNPPDDLSPEVYNYPQLCCKIPPMFKSEDYTACNKIPVKDDFPKPPFSDCSDYTCLLNRQGLKDKERVNEPRYIAFLDSFTAKYPKFKDVVDLAKEKCFKEHRFYDSQCGPYTCTRNVIFMNCPAWEETEQCQILRQHVYHCKIHWNL